MFHSAASESAFRIVISMYVNGTWILLLCTSSFFSRLVLAIGVRLRPVPPSCSDVQHGMPWPDCNSSSPYSPYSLRVCAPQTDSTTARAYSLSRVPAPHTRIPPFPSSAVSQIANIVCAHGVHTLDVGVCFSCMPSLSSMHASALFVKKLSHCPHWNLAITALPFSVSLCICLRCWYLGPLRGPTWDAKGWPPRAFFTSELSALCAIPACHGQATWIQSQTCMHAVRQHFGSIFNHVMLC